MTKMGTKYQAIKKFIFAISGLSIILYIFFSRILIKLPKELSTSLTYFEAFFVAIVILFFLGLFILNLRVYYKLFYSEEISPQSSFITKIVTWLNLHVVSIYWNSLKEIDDFIKHTVLGPRLGTFMDKNYNAFHDRRGVTSLTRIYDYIWLCFNFLPRVVVLCLLILDVFYYHKFHYVYIWGWLLLLPSIYNYIVFSYREFSEYNIDLINDNIVHFFKDDYCLTTEDIINHACLIAMARRLFLKDETMIDIDELHDSVKLIQEYKDENNIDDDSFIRILMFYQERLIYFYTCRRDVAIFESFKRYYGIIFNIIRFLLYSIIWFYVLMYGLGYISST
jgi:hypothetical protein